MAATSLGLVGIVSKGDYSASATYIKGNFVYHNQSTWLCIAETITGSEPSESNSNWQLLAKGVQLVVFTGATASTDGTMGAVPQPHAGDEGKFLKGSGGWANVPNPQVFTGATASADGTSGLVPVPHMGDENKFIRGDGSWASAAADDNAVKTLEEWNALPLAEKIKFKTADITDDFNGSPVDSALSDTSINPVQNKVVKAAIDGMSTVEVTTITRNTDYTLGGIITKKSMNNVIMVLMYDLRVSDSGVSTINDRKPLFNIGHSWSQGYFQFGAYENLTANNVGSICVNKNGDVYFFKNDNWTSNKYIEAAFTIVVE